MNGERIVVEYGDQNDGMERFLPRSGTIVRWLRAKNWGTDWCLVKLDQPFDYEINGKGFIKRALLTPTEIHVTHFFIKSRWVGESIEARHETSVFVLLVDQPPPEEQEVFDSEDFYHACWGMLKYGEK